MIYWVFDNNIGSFFFPGLKHMAEHQTFLEVHVQCSLYSFGILSVYLISSYTEVA